MYRLLQNTSVNFKIIFVSLYSLEINNLTQKSERFVRQSSICKFRYNWMKYK